MGLESDRFSWAGVKGPIATVVANLYRLGWKPQSPNKRLDNEGLEWEITSTDEQLNHRQITETILKSCSSNLDNQVADHIFGGRA